MTRVLRIELRRSAAVGTALILAVAGTLLLYFAEGIGFATGWMQLAMVQRLFLAVLWPLALAAGAWQARRERRSKVRELFASTPRPLAQRALPTVLAMTLAVTCGYLVQGLAGAAWIAGTARYLPVSVFVVVAVGVLSLIAAVWLGLAAGRLLPSPVTAPAVAVAGLAFLLLVPGMTRPKGWLAVLFSPIYEMNMPNAYNAVPGRVSAAQALWLLGLAAGAILLVVSASWRLRLAALLPVALGFALGVTVIPHGERIVNAAVDPVANALVCTGDAPRVCVTRVHSGLLSEVTGPAREALTLLARIPGTPTEVHEDNTVWRPVTYPPRDAGVALLRVETGQDAHLADREDVLGDVVTDAFSNHVSCESFDGRSEAVAAAFWLIGREPVIHRDHDPETVTEATALWHTLNDMPGDQAQAKVTALRQAAVSCTATDGFLAGATP